MPDGILSIAGGQLCFEYITYFTDWSPKRSPRPYIVGTHMPEEEWRPLVREKEIKVVEGALAGSAM